MYIRAHPLPKLKGALAVIARDRPSLLVEAEERHRSGALRSVREILEPLGYEGYMLYGGALVSVRRFDPSIHQNAKAAERRRLTGQRGDEYVNNFLFIAS